MRERSPDLFELGYLDYFNACLVGLCKGRRYGVHDDYVLQVLELVMHSEDIDRLVRSCKDELEFSVVADIDYGFCAQCVIEWNRDKIGVDTGKVNIYPFWAIDGIYTETLAWTERKVLNKSGRKVGDPIMHLLVREECVWLCLSLEDWAPAEKRAVVILLA